MFDDDPLLRRLTNEKPKKIDRNVQHSDRIIGMVVTTFFQLGEMIIKMTYNLLSMLFNGIKNKIKNRNKRAED